MNRRYSVFVFALLGLSIANPAFAQRRTAPSAPEKPKEEKPKDDKAKEEKEKDKKTPEEKIVTSKHSVKIGGQVVNYTATAGTILLKLEDGTPNASIFYM